METIENKVVVFDLDDTLYKEIDFLKSAFHDISEIIATNIGINKDTVYNDLMKFYDNNENAFECVIKKFDLKCSLEYLLNFYRTHKPKLIFSKSNTILLNELQAKGVKLCVLTDGRIIQQQNKIEALGISSYFSEIIISEEFGSEKPNISNYKHFENKFGIGDYYYIGDNIKKDFISPNRLNWTTICLINNGCNIHEQNFNVPQEYLPTHKVLDLIEVTEVLKI